MTGGGAIKIEGLDQFRHCLVIARRHARSRGGNHAGTPARRGASVHRFGRRIDTAIASIAGPRPLARRGTQPGRVPGDAPALAQPRFLGMYRSVIGPS